MLGRFKKKKNDNEVFLKNGNLNKPLIQKNADVFLKHGHSETARKMFYTLLDAGDHESGTYIGIGRSFEQENKQNDAIKYYDTALELKGEDSSKREAAERLAAIQIQNGDNAAALSTLKRAQKFTKTNQEKICFMVSEANCLLRLNRIDEAFIIFLKVLKIDPANLKAISGLGKLYFQFGDFEKSIDYFSKIIFSGTFAPREFYYFCQACLKSRNFNLALKASELPTAKYSDHHMISFTRAMVLYRNKKFNQAKRVVEKLLGENENHSGAWELKRQINKAISRGQE